MACTECVTSFFIIPWKTSIVIASVFLSILFFVLMKRSTAIKHKLIYLYLHLFATVFPFMFYAFYRGCTTLFSQCNTVPPIAIMLIFTSITTTILAAVIGPMMFLKRYMNQTVPSYTGKKFTEKSSKDLGISHPHLYVINEQRPIAFSLSYWKSRIFISVGLIEILSKHELNAVIAHELGHVKNKSSIIKWSAHLFSLLSPLGTFASFHSELNEEEYHADNTAFLLQRTKKHIISARKKIEEYEKYDIQ